LNNRFLATRFKQTGTRFLIYRQVKSLRGFAEPEIVYIDAVPGGIQAGPGDERIYVVDAKNKKPYHLLGQWPPYVGRRHPQAMPDAEGHFDHITPDEDTFSSTTVYATIRFVLMVWEHYLGRKVRWWFRDTYPRLEVIPRVDWKGNATSRYGYIEFGFEQLGRSFELLCQNFDVVAHEVGHMILKDVIGNPDYRTPQFRAHEEAAADLVALVASLHFESAVTRLLHETKGNLFSINVLSRFAELSKARQIRNAFNRDTMSKLPWDPNPDNYKYDLARPFTGAAYDVFVHIYELKLVRRGAIPKKLAQTLPNARGRSAEFARYFKRKTEAFKAGLLSARDDFAKLLVRTWEKTSMHDFDYQRVVKNMMDAAVELKRTPYASIIHDSFVRRKILPSS